MESVGAKFVLRGGRGQLLDITLGFVLNESWSVRRLSESNVTSTSYKKSETQFSRWLYIRMDLVSWTQLGLLAHSKLGNGTQRNRLCMAVESNSHLGWLSGW